MTILSKTYTVSFKKIISYLLTGMLSVWVLHLAMTAFYFSKLTDIKSEKYLALELFFFEFEKNIPSFFSAFLLLFCGYLLITISQKSESVFSKRLGYVFFFLACDEWFCIHEALNQIQISYLPSWVFFYFPLAIAIFVFSIPFLRSLPTKLALLTLFSGAMYIFGSLVFEVSNVTFASSNFNNPLFQTLLFFEDGFEMLGAFMFIVTLLLLLKEKYHLTHLTLPIKRFAYVILFGKIDGIISY